MMIVDIDSDFIKRLYIYQKEKPYFIFDLDNNKKVIHNIQFFLNSLDKYRVKFIKFKEDFIYLISDNRVYKYAYGYYLRGMD